MRVSIAAAFLLLLASTLRGAGDAAAVALLVHETSLAAEILVPHVRSSDPIVRATAARVALVREVAIVAALREALAAETVAETAREQVRAVVILGGDDDVAFAAQQLARFPSSIDTDFAAAVARVGAPRAIDLHLRHRAALRNPAPSIKYALWGRSAHLTSTAARLLGAKDERAFTELLNVASGSLQQLDPGVVAAALSSESDEIVVRTLWYVIESWAAEPAAMPSAIRERAVSRRERASAEETFARIILERMLGAKITTHTESIPWLRTPLGHARVPQRKPILRFLSLEEQDALRDEALGKLPPAPKGATTAVREPSFALPPTLPPGLAELLLKETRCSDGWLGIAKATVDRAGRVQTVDLSNVTAARGCRRAIATILRLTLAEPSSINAPLAANDLLVVKAERDASCLDDNLVDGVIAGATSETPQVGGDVKPPQALRRVEPHFPASVRRQVPEGTVHLVVIESLISRSGCVRDLRLLSQTQWGELNGAAVKALSRWKFKPGTLNGVPVDVIFNITVSFKLGL